MRRTFWWGAATSVAIAACVADDPSDSTSSTPDASTLDTSVATDDGSAPNDSGAPTDGGIKTGPCDPDAPFGTPVALATLNATSSRVANLRLSKDGLDAYFSAVPTDGATLFALFEATRATTSDDFGPATEIYAAAYSGAPSVTADNLWLYYSESIGTNQIYVDHRTATTAFFGKDAGPVKVGGSVDQPLTDDGGAMQSNYEPYIREDGTILYFTTGRLSGGADMFSAESTGDGGFGEATIVSEIAAAVGHSTRSPAITPDGLVLYFASETLPDGGSQMAHNIWVATRASTSVPFSNVRYVSELAFDQDTFPDYITSDRCTLYFSHSSLGGVSTGVFYSVTKSP